MFLGQICIVLWSQYETYTFSKTIKDIYAYGGKTP